MTGTFDLLLSRYGQKVTLTPRATGQPVALRAFLQLAQRAAAAGQDETAIS